MLRSACDLDVFARCEVEGGPALAPAPPAEPVPARAPEEHAVDQVPRKDLHRGHRLRADRAVKKKHGWMGARTEGEGGLRKPQHDKQMHAKLTDDIAELSPRPPTPPRPRRWARHRSSSAARAALGPEARATKFPCPSGTNEAAAISA